MKHVLLVKRVGRRRVTNWSGVLELVANYAKKKVGLPVEERALEKLPISQQIKLFAEAHTVVAPHGAGGVFLAAMPAGSRFIELNGYGNMMYLRMAMLYDLNTTAIPYDQESGAVDLVTLGNVL